MTGPLHAHDASRHLRVLVIDDCRDYRRLLNMMLQKFGAIVLLAEEGAEGCRAAIEAEAAGDPFDLILMDMQMPVLDGYEATRRLRESGCERPVIALTAQAASEDEERCLRAGCDDFLAKPVSLQALTRLLACWCGQSVHPGTTGQSEV